MNKYFSITTQLWCLCNVRNHSQIYGIILLCRLQYLHIHNYRRHI